MRALGRCSRLVYGVGFVDDETVGKFDPPLNGEGWQVVDQVCETKHSTQCIQAACYVKAGLAVDHLHPVRDGRRIGKEDLDQLRPVPGVAIVAFRGTVSMEGFWQDVSLTFPGLKRRIRRAVREAVMFYEKCAEEHPGYKMYVTGHSLGGYIAEAVASYCDVDGASFNNPGPWSARSIGNVTGEYRPAFEIHLTRSDRVAATFFPKPETSSHVGTPHWHPGRNHRICKSYVVEVASMFGVRPNDIPFDPESLVDQMEGIEEHYGYPSDLESASEGEVCNECA